MEGRKDSIDEVVMRQVLDSFNLVITVIAVVGFLVTYFISMNCFKPLNDDQFKQLEQVAREVYAQKENHILEVPEGICVREDQTTITVKYDAYKYQSKVIAELKNGELVMTRDDESDGKIASALLGVAGAALAVALFTRYVQMLSAKGEDK